MDNVQESEVRQRAEIGLRIAHQLEVLKPADVTANVAAAIVETVPLDQLPAIESALGQLIDAEVIAAQPSMLARRMVASWETIGEAKFLLHPIGSNASAYINDVAGSTIFRRQYLRVKFALRDFTGLMYADGEALTYQGDKVQVWDVDYPVAADATMEQLPPALITELARRLRRVEAGEGEKKSLNSGSGCATKGSNVETPSEGKTDEKPAPDALAEPGC